MIHTKGEWVAVQHTLRTFKIVNKNRIEEIARVFSDSRLKKHNGITVNELEANAKLIAAAPEMLKALKEAERFHQGFHSPIGIIIREAIKKAQK